MPYGYQKMVIIGNLGQDPVQRDTNSGGKMATFSVAVNERKDGETVWFNCKAFDKQAEAALTYLHRGDPVLAEIRYSPREYTPEGASKKVVSPEWIIGTLRFMGKANPEATTERPAPARPTTPKNPRPAAGNDELFADDDATSGGGDYPF